MLTRVGTYGGWVYKTCQGAVRCCMLWGDLVARLGTANHFATEGQARRFHTLWMFPFDIAILISFLLNLSLQTDFVKDINFCNLGGKVQRDGGRPSGTFEVA